MIETTLRDFRVGIRSLRKNPGFTLVALMTLALGIGANTAIFSVVETVLLRPLPYPAPEQLVSIWNTYPPQVPRAGLSPGDFADWKKEASSFAEMGGHTEISKGMNLTGDGEPQRVQVAYGSASLFSVLGIHPVAGRMFLPEEDRAGNAPNVALSHRLWVSRFGGDTAVVGRQITLDNNHYTIVGILPPGFDLLRWADVWMPLGQYDDDLSEHVHHSIVAVARLKPGVSLDQASAEIAQLHRQEAIAYPESHKNFGVLVETLRDRGASQLRKTLLVLAGAVGLVLLIACANIMNLLLVRNSSREKEIALRAALGASPWQLVRQLLIESLLLSFAGGILGIGLAFAGLRALLAFVPANLAAIQAARLDGRVLGYTAILCVITGAVCGLLPALRTITMGLAGTLKDGSKGSKGSGAKKTLDGLVIAEVAMAIVPLVSAGLLLRSFDHLLKVDPGFRPEHVLTMEIQRAVIPYLKLRDLSTAELSKMGQTQAMKFERIAAEVQALPGVKSVGGIDDLPLGTDLRQATRFVVEGRPPLVAGARPLGQNRAVSLGYFAAMGIPLLSGRTFDSKDFPLSNTIINEAMAKRFWGSQDPLGKRIDLCSLDTKPCWLTIVGVVGNVHQFGLEAEPTYDIYYSDGWTPYLVVRTESDPAALTAAIREVVHRADPSLPVARVITLEDLLSESVSPRRFSAALIAIFATLALLLAAVGIYGVMSFAVSNRTQEIGIRMALGASPQSVQNMILGRSLALTLAGVALGLVGSLALMRFLASLLFGVSTYDGITFAGVALVLTGVALAASYIPARRAVRVDPLVALRYE
jgi:putative ABC transport system permease protein